MRLHVRCRPRSRRSWLLPVLISFLVGAWTGCGAKVPDQAGYLVLGDPVADSVLVAGDTFQEVSRLLAPTPIVERASRIADSLQYPVNCSRLFVRPPHYLVLAEPFCGREPVYGDGSEDAFHSPELRLLDADGRVIDAQGLTLASLRVLCPAKRRPDGSVYPRKPIRLDECQRRTYDIPLTERPEGIVVPTGVILPSAVTVGMLDQCSRAVPERANAEWTPRPEQIVELEHDLSVYMEREGAGRLLVPLEKYRRQYGGYVDGSDSLIYVNAFLPHPMFEANADWHRQPIMACDGGESFWGVSYDPARRRFVGLAFNGHA